MTIMSRGRNRRSSAHGFTMIELLVYVVLALIVLGAAFNVFIAQSGQHGLHRETMDARETLRGAAALLTAEMRGLSASRGDLYAIAPQSITLRSPQGSGVICVKHVSQPRYGVWQVSGTFQATADDSALVYSVSTGAWNSVKIDQVWDPPSGGISTCAWPGAVPPDVVPQVVVSAPSDTAGVTVGSGFRVFRRTEFGMFQQDGRWWLGRKVGAAASYELVTGPLRPPADSGLALHYYDAAGVETADPTQVTRVEIVIRSESFGKARSAQGVTTRFDSVTVVAFLRN